MGSLIRPYVKVDYLAIHPARVANKDDSNFRPIFALSTTRTIFLYHAFGADSSQVQGVFRHLLLLLFLPKG